MQVIVRPLDSEGIQSVLTARLKRRADSHARALSMNLPKMTAYINSGRAEEIGAMKDRRLVSDLQLHPEQRLANMLLFRIPIEQNDKDEDTKQFSMLEWLLRARDHLTSGDLDQALVELHNMKMALGSAIVPDSLNVDTDAWADVTFA